MSVLPLLTVRDLWHSDEPRYAQVAREIVTGGDAVVMHVNDAIYREKPPLLFWMQAALGQWRGDVDALAARLPSALAALLGVLLTYAWARRLRLGAHAFLAGALLATTFDWWWLAQRAAFDVVLATFVVAALLCEEIARRHATRAGRLGWRLLFAVALGFGFLAKGPPVLLFGIVGHLAREWAARRTRQLEPGWRTVAAGTSGARVARGFGEVVLQLLAFAAVLSIWIGPLWARLGFDDLLANFQRQTAGRMGEEAPHSQPFWYYLTTLPGDSLPWSLAWLVALIAAWRARGRAMPAQHDPAAALAAPAALSAAIDDVAARAEARRFLLAFVLAIVALFSAIRGKRSLYLLPLQPALALLTALLLAHLAGSAEAARRKCFRLVVASAVLLTGGALWLMPRLDAGFTLAGRTFPARSPRPLGAALAELATPADTVVALSLRHPDSLRYYSEGERRARGLPLLAPLVLLELPKRDDEAAASDAARQLQELAERRGAQLLIVCEPRDAARLPALLHRELELLRALVSDDRDYQLLRVRG